MQVDAVCEGQGHRGSTPLTSTIFFPKRETVARRRQGDGGHYFSAGRGPRSAGFVLNLVPELLHVLAETLGGLAAGGEGDGRGREQKEREAFERGIHGGIIRPRPLPSPWGVQGSTPLHLPAGLHPMPLLRRLLGLSRAFST